MHKALLGSLSIGFVYSITACSGEAPLVESTPDDDGGDTLGSRTNRIVGGTDADIRDYPWQVSLQDQSFGQFCGGSVVHERWVITAAHCVEDGAPFFVRAATTRSNSRNGQDRDVADVIVHPEYNGFVEDGRDIALVRLVSPLDLSDPRVAAIPLVTATNAAAGLTDPGVLSVITGWGSTREGGSTVTTLQQASIPIVSLADAIDAYGFNIGSDQIAAGILGVGIVDACQGDSGGPLVVPSQGSFALAGVVSWGNGCARPDFPGLYARVSSFEDFISANAPELGGSTPPPPPPPTAGLVITEVLADPPSDYDANGDGSPDVVQDEFVELVNASSVRVDLSGATLSDGIRVRYTFADGTSVSPGEFVLVFGGGFVSGVNQA